MVLLSDEVVPLPATARAGRKSRTPLPSSLQVGANEPSSGGGRPSLDPRGGE